MPYYRGGSLPGRRVGRQLSPSSGMAELGFKFKATRTKGRWSLLRQTDTVTIK